MGGKLKKQPLRWKSKAFRRKVLKAVLSSLFSIALFFALVIFIIFSYYSKGIPDITEIANKDVKPNITIYDDNNVVLAKYGDFKGDNLTYSQIPVYMVQAVIAAEDHRFFDHFGIDIWGILRAYWVNFQAGRVVQGGSTVTQQFAKIIFLSPERTFKRKIQEIIIAIELERKFSKEQIIAMYLNRVYLGKGNYGIDAASRYYFGKRADDINLFEAAMLAGMLKAPSRYSPSNNPALSVSRAKTVLEQMYEEGFISQEQLKYSTPPQIMQRGLGRGALKNPYFTDYILSVLPDLIENPGQDLKIYTTLDMEAQEALENAITKHMKSAPDKFGVSQAAGIVMEPNGAIKAMVGGKSYQESQYNRAYMSKRQPGSAFKFFVYTAAVENGLQLNDTFVDQPISISLGRNLGTWEPRNFDRGYRGNMTVEKAFAHSINTITVQIAESIGRQKIIELTHRLGVKSEIENLPSIALGVSGISLLEMTQSFAQVANDGNKSNAFGIVKITNAEDEVLYQHPSLVPDQVLSEDTVEKVKSLLASTVEYGTAKYLKSNFKTVYAKTGTSQEHKDAWVIGFTGNMVIGVWVGNDDNSPTNRVSGGNLPAHIFKDYIDHVRQVRETELPEGQTGWQANIFDFFGSSSDDAPTENPESTDEVEEEAQ